MCIFYPSLVRLTSPFHLLLFSFFFQTNHLKKFLEFRVGMGIVDNMVAKCKYIIVVVLLQLMELIFSNLE